MLRSDNAVAGDHELLRDDFDELRSVVKGGGC